jgi:hypothetical protein
MPHQLDFRLLGPLEVRDDGRSLALGGRKQRSLLAILLLHANKAVSDDQLTDGLRRKVGENTFLSGKCSQFLDFVGRRKQYAWIVPTNRPLRASRPARPVRCSTRTAMRSFSSCAARSVNVNATIARGSIPSATMSATRWATTSVLPEPAEAMI